MISSDASMVAKIHRFIQTVRRSGLQTAINQTVLYFELNVVPQSGCVIGQELPPTTSLHHPTGIVIAGRAQIGDHVHIYQNVTIGSKDGQYPTIEDNVRIYPGAVIIGGVTVGKGATVGANAVVVDDVPENTVVAGVPAVEIGSNDPEGDTQ